MQHLQPPAPGAPPGLLGVLPRTGLVHIVTGSFGAGHDSAAREIALRFEARGYTTRTWDVVDLFPGRLGQLLRASYLAQIQRAPRSWGAVLDHLQPGQTLHALTCRGLELTHRRLGRVCGAGTAGRGHPTGPDVIVSTHPFASQALGQLRGRGLLATPVITYLTDMSVHPLWVHPAVDLHLAVHEIPAAEARRWGGRTTVVRPLVPDAYESGPGSGRADARECRRAIGLPVGPRLALLTGGSLGIGELELAARDVADTGLARPVVLCARNDELYERLGRRPEVSRLGWRDDMPRVLRAVDCVVQNSGGFLSLEALAAVRPAVSYRCLPGHGEANAAALESAGLIPWARDARQLEQTLARSLTKADHAVGTRHMTNPVGLDIVDAVFPPRVRVPA